MICDSPREATATIVVGGHLDFIDAGQGIVDDWSGAAMLASLYETLKPQTSKHSFEFVAFTDAPNPLRHAGKTAHTA